MISSNIKITVVGLGYVGLPLALSMAKRFPVVGYDSDVQRMRQLADGIDRTEEVPESQLRQSTLTFADNLDDIADSNIFIVTVPTPIDADNAPDLAAIRAACATVGGIMRPGAVVVFESTVYPGVTEDICGPELEKASGLTCGTDFFLGYSPERINPGDTVRTIENIIKVVAGQTPEITQLLAEIYGAAVPAGIHTAPSIRVAEAAKVIENAQRDINIAFINEVTMIFQRMGIDTTDVLAAARTKWNFLDFRPGLVGGHCIGVDPFYLAHAARAVGRDPEVILAGRRINDGMANFAADQINAYLGGPSRVLVLGLTFKENVRDLRNSKVVDMVRTLRRQGHEVEVHDPIAHAEEALALYGIELQPDLSPDRAYDAVVAAVAHDAYRQMAPAGLEQMMASDALLADLKGIWRDERFSPNIRRWCL